MDNEINTSAKELYNIRKCLKTYGYTNLVLNMLLAPLILFLCYGLIIPYDCSVSSVFICTTPSLRALGVLIAIYYIAEFVASDKLLSISKRMLKTKNLQFESNDIVKEINICSIFMGIFLIPTTLLASKCQDYFSRNYVENSKSSDKKLYENYADYLKYKSNQYAEKSLTSAKWSFVLNLAVVAITIFMLVMNCKRNHSCIISNFFSIPICIVSFIFMFSSLINALIASNMLQKHKIKINSKLFIYPLIDLLIMIIILIFINNIFM